MHHRLRFVMASLLLLLLFASLVVPPAAARPDPPAPVSPLGTPGSWYSGGTPPNHDPARPVLVFVHGKGGSAAAWWSDTAYHGPNDMYAYAYSNGYRTAFVDLEPEGDMWANGQILHQQLVEITQHFAVPKVVIIAHSKGGVDTNAAATFFGAGPLIDKVITLGSPHWGSPLADLAYSTWAWWLAALLGENTDATYVMQTGYMAWFRSVADEPGDPVGYYTVGGRKCGPFLTALWWGCVYLAGEDDGVVPLASQHKPGSVNLVDGLWDHDELRMGSRVWGVLSGQLQPSSAGATDAGLPGPAGASPAALGNMIARGGEVLGTAAGEPFPLESGVRKASLVFYASSPDFRATVTGPDGSVHTVAMQGQLPVGDSFAGAWAGSVEIQDPAPGSWRFETTAPARAGYFMVAALDSDLRVRLDMGEPISAPAGRQTFTVASTRAPKTVAATGAISVGGGRPYAQSVFGSGPGSSYRATVTVPQQQGIHNLSVTVTGTLADGSAFERALVGSFAVVPQGTAEPWTGK